MKVKVIFIFMATGLSLAAGSSSSQGTPPREIQSEKKELQEVDAQIEALLDQAKEVRAKRDQLQDEADAATDPAEQMRLEKLADAQHELLLQLLFQIEDLLKKREFILNELGDPDDEESSPYQI